MMSFSELHDYFRTVLRSSQLPYPGEDWNPVDHISSLWTILKKQKKLQSNFNPEFTELLDRQPEDRKNNKRFSYWIRRPYYQAVKTILAELNKDNKSKDVESMVEKKLSEELNTPTETHQTETFTSLGPRAQEGTIFNESRALDILGIPDDTEIEELSTRLFPGEFPALSSMDDACNRILRSIRLRRGQANFREALISAYGGKCAITRCNSVYALESAHIRPYNGEKTNKLNNGILLRADIHTLFDLHLIGIHPEFLTVSIARELRETPYQLLQRQKLSKPINPSLRPDKLALQWRWDLHMKRWT